MRPLLEHHKRDSLTPGDSNRFFHAMSWVWCGLLALIGASSVRGNWSDPSSFPPVAACWFIRRVCTRPWPSVRPILRPRAPTVNKSWILDAFDACVGACRVSEVTGLNVPSSLFPLTLILTIGFTYRAWVLHRRLPPIPTSIRYKWNPSVESSLAPDTPCLFFLCRST